METGPQTAIHWAALVFTCTAAGRQLHSSHSAPAFYPHISTKSSEALPASRLSFLLRGLLAEEREPVPWSLGKACPTQSQGFHSVILSQGFGISFLVFSCGVLRCSASSELTSWELWEPPAVTTSKRQGRESRLGGTQKASFRIGGMDSGICVQSFTCVSPHSWWRLL